MDQHRAFENAERDIEDAVDAGHLTPEEAGQELHELHRDWRRSAEEAAQRAYDDEIDRW